MLALTTLEPFLVAVRSLYVSTDRTPLTGVLGNKVAEFGERKRVQTTVHACPVLDVVSHVFESSKTSTGLSNR